MDVEEEKAIIENLKSQSNKLFEIKETLLDIFYVMIAFTFIGFLILIIYLLSILKFI